MKKLLLLLAFPLLLLSCGKDKQEPSPLPVLPSLESLVGTEWEGSFVSPVEYQGNTINMKLVWTMDFLTDTTGALLVEVSSPFSQTEYNDFDFSYSFDGSTAGYIYTGNDAEPFTVDPVNQTLTIDIQMPVGLGEEGQQTILGGVTTLYRVR
ncbi:MAG: hypothetical protein IJ524_00260 [Bacteroidales bacterium]|nr:hypothetical protein [Bacteroidales bacterium]